MSRLDPKPSSAGGALYSRHRGRAGALAASLSIAMVSILLAPTAQAAPLASTSTVATPVATATIATLRTLQTSRPAISGTVRVGNKLTAKVGTWTSGTTFRYAWRVNGVKVGTSKTFTPTSSHRGKKLTVTVTGSKSGYRTLSRTSYAKTVGYGVFSAPKPTIAGTLAGGATLTAKRGTWSSAPSTVKYQWRANGIAIAGATASTFKLSREQLGKKISVSVTGSRPGYTTKTITSASTAAVRSTRAVPYEPGTTARLNVWTVRTGSSAVEPHVESGRQLASVPVHACYTGSGNTTPWLDLSIEYVGTDGIVYDDLDFIDWDDAFPSEIWDYDDVYSGACIDFTGLALVPGAAVTGGTWRITDAYSWSVMPVQFFDGVN